MGAKDSGSGGNRCNALRSKSKVRQDSPTLPSLWSSLHPAAPSGPGDGLLPSVNPLQKCPHRPAQKHVSVLIPDTVNLVPQITCHRGTVSPA